MKHRTKVDDLIERLAQMPAKLSAAIEASGVEPAGLEWTPRQVLAHIRATDLIQASQIFLISVRSGLLFPGIDERALAENAGFDEDDVGAALQTYASRRAELVKLLRRLDPDDWARPAMHEAWGKVDLEFWVRHVAEHEEEHLGQIRGAWL